MRTQRLTPTRGLAWGVALTLVSTLGFGLYKTRAIAHELTNPPFYRPQPLSRVEETFRDLARGGEGDPGGQWQAREVAGVQVWTLKRAKAAPGTVVLLHGFGDDRWGTSPALRWFPALDAVIFTYRRRDELLRAGKAAPPVTFGARESEEVVRVVHDLEAGGLPRHRIVLAGRSLGATVGLLALAKLEAEGRGPVAGIVWEGAPPSSRAFAEALVRGRKDRVWHPLLAPAIGEAGSRWAARLARYDRRETDVLHQLGDRRLATPSLCFLATQDRLASPASQRLLAQRFIACEMIEVPTWHLHCAEILGSAYPEAIRKATERWLE